MLNVSCVMYDDSVRGRGQSGQMVQRRLLRQNTDVDGESATFRRNNRPPCYIYPGKTIIELIIYILIYFVSA